MVIQSGKDGMISGMVGVSGRIRYQIHATPREREGLGVVISSTRLESLDATVTVFDSGMVIIESPRRHLEFDLASGAVSMR